MRVCLAEASQRSTEIFQVYFSDTLISDINNYLPLPYTPQISISTGFVNDTASWQLVTGDFVAGGGEQYLLIGNFNSDANTNWALTGFGVYSEAYYYVDYVSLNIAKGDGMLSMDDHPSVKVYPDVFSENINVAVSRSDNYTLSLYDMAARKLLQQEFTNALSLNTATLANGVYYYEVRNRNSVIKHGKLIKD